MVFSNLKILHSNPVLYSLLFTVTSLLRSPFRNADLSKEFGDLVDKDIKDSLVDMPGHAAATKTVIESFRNNGTFGREVRL